MLFIFKWHHPKRNRYYNNKYIDWKKCEQRINNLRAFGIYKICWITANLE